MLEIHPVKNLTKIENIKLQFRAEGAISEKFLPFLLLLDGKEAAFLAFEDWSDQSLGFIYEIYVLPEFRHKGLGNELLEYAEELCITLGCDHLELEANNIEPAVNKDTLVSWFSRKGFTKAESNTERMTKPVN